MVRRLAGVVLVACALLALPGVAQAEIPAGPRLTFMESADSGFKLISADPSGGDQKVIVGGRGRGQLLPFPFNPPTWSGDGSRVAFTGITYTEKNVLLDIYEAAADGTGVIKLPGTAHGLDPVLSPDGRFLAFVRQQAENAGEPVYSPDGTRLAIITVGKPRTVGSKGESTTFSPTELAVAAADGSGLTKLTHTPNLELQPSWDPSGQRLAYTLFRASGGEADFLGIGDSIMEINADGQCRTKVLSVPNATLYGATWQPGPGREAGPIAC